MIVFSSMNRKGGTGKTTLSVNLSAIFASPEFKNKILKQKGPSFRVLYVDLDAQGNGTTTLQSTYKTKPGAMEVMRGESDIKAAISHSPFEGVDVLQGKLSLDDAEEILHDTSAKQFLLKRCLDSVRDEYDFVFIDCPPGKNILTTNALTASDYVLIPMEATSYAVEGVQIMTTFINEVCSKYNSSLKIAGIVLIKKERSSAQDGYATVIRECLPYHVFNQMIRKSTVAEQSASKRMPLYYFSNKSEITKDFISLSKEVYYVIEGDK